MKWGVGVDYEPRCKLYYCCGRARAHSCRFFSIFVFASSFLAGFAMRRRRCEAGLRSSLLRQMQVLMHMLKKNMCPYLHAMLDLAAQCWTVRAGSRVLHCRIDFSCRYIRSAVHDLDFSGQLDPWSIFSGWRRWCLSVGVSTTRLFCTCLPWDLYNV